MEKHGFVYLWRDRKNKRYYVGSHWGTDDDGYVCSSNWMRTSYSRRPEDFKRRIIARVYTNRQDLLDEEFRWLAMIKSNEIKLRYFNLNLDKNGHWSAQDYEKDVKKRISEQTKKAMNRPEVREKMLESYASRDWSQTDETRNRRSQSMKKAMAAKYPIESRRASLSGVELTNHLKEKSVQLWSNRSNEDKIAIGSKISESLQASKQARSEAMKTTKWWNNGTINRRCKEQPGPEWSPGRF